jgi:hypothetical protein
MQEGFLPDNCKHGPVVATWVAGKPDLGGLFGSAKVDGRQTFYIKSFRCIACGYLELYAPDSQ